MLSKTIGSFVILLCMKVTILQWNVWYREKSENIMRELQKFNADIVCLQEVSPELAEQAATATGYSKYYIVTLKTTERQMGNAIFSRFPLLSSASIVTQAEDKASSRHDKESRYYLEATLQLPSQTLSMGTIHASYTRGFIESPYKTAETNKLMEAVSNHRENYILAGDFNAVPESSTIRTLEKHLKHAGPDYRQNTWSSKRVEYTNFVAEGLNWRLDYVFTTPDINVVDSKILQTEASDHLPILTTIEL